MDEDHIAPDSPFQETSIPPSVKRLGWVSFFTDFASEMVYPVVPLFLVALGAPAMALGFIEGGAEAIVSLLKGVTGWHCDRMGKRVVYVRLGYGLAALSKPIMALASSWGLVLFSRSLDRVGKGLRSTARDVMIADAIHPGIAGKAFGFHRAMDTAGAIAGVLASALFLWLLPGQFRAIFLLAAIPGALAVWLTFRLKDTPRPAGETCPNPRGSLFAALRRPGLPPAYWRTLAPLLVFALANSSDAFLLLRAKNLGLGDSGVILAYALFNVTYALAAYPLGALSDRFGRWKMILAGWTIYAGVYLGLSLTSEAGPVWWLFPVYGFYMALTEGIGKALVSRQAPAEKRGVAMGIFQMAVGLVMLVSSVLAGVLWDMIGPGAPFLFGGLAALAAILSACLMAPWKEDRQVS